jgi:Glu-tRNA(Gln) amidotransferase subunit E-like FAD-binding protein
MLSKQPAKRTAEIYNSYLIKDEYPEIFLRIKNKYIEAIGLMIENRIYKQEASHKLKLLEISAELGFMKAEPRDLIIMHKEAITQLTANVPERRKILIKEEGRIALIELMGYLLSHYRNLNS